MNTKNSAKNIFKPQRVLLPILFGLMVTFYMFYSSFDPKVFSSFNWAQVSISALVISLLMMLLRDLAYIVRIRVLTDGQLSWRQSFETIMLWEFSSAVSPSVVGGVAPALYILYKEGLNSGKSTAIVLTSIFLDELFFIIMVPILYFVVGHNEIFHQIPMIGSFTFPIWTIFLIGYIAIFIYTLLLAYALFVNPNSIKKLLSLIFLIPGLRSKRMKMRKLGNQLTVASNGIKGKSLMFWIKAFGATFVSWTGRYWVVNFLVMVFFFDLMGVKEHLLIYARQLVLWIILLISPTPGASGFAEAIFTSFLTGIINEKSWIVALAALWRIITYYPYLLAGVIILPGWIKRKH